MKMTLTRTSKQEGFTTGILCVGNEIVAHTLEPQYRDLRKEKKVPGQTAVPEGTYHIELLFSAHFKRLMPYLANVPGFTGIMVHCGNRPSDSRGCILVGERAMPDRLANSRHTFDVLYGQIESAKKRNEEIILVIK